MNSLLVNSYAINLPIGKSVCSKPMTKKVSPIHTETIPIKIFLLLGKDFFRMANWKKKIIPTTGAMLISMS